MKNNNSKQYEYAGGVVRDKCIYVPREIDNRILEAILDNDALIYIQAPRQSGKTSLIKRLETILKEDYNYSSVYIDLRVSAGAKTAVSWYKVFFEEISKQLQIDNNRVTDFIKEFEKNPISKSIVDYFDSFVIQKFHKVIIFIDEMDYTMSFTSFTDWLFDAIRTIFSNRMNKGLSIVMAGVAHPSMLIKDASAYNVGEIIKIPEFELTTDNLKQWTDGLPFEEGVKEIVGREVFRQTGGQARLMSYMFNKVIVAQAITKKEVEKLADEIIHVDSTENLYAFFSTPAEFIKIRHSFAYRLLIAYREILDEDRPLPEYDDQIVIGLFLTGLVIITKDNKLKVKCPIYTAYYNKAWCDRIEATIGHPDHRGYIKGSKNEKSPKKRLCVINVGGTIGMERQPDDTIATPYDANDFFRTNYNKIFQIADVNIINLFSKDSVNVFPEDWKELSEKIFKLKKNEDYDGFVITHGTDTLAYTASAVAFAFSRSLDFPIVFLGSQAPHDVLYGDAEINLIRACQVASYSEKKDNDIVKIREVVVVFNDEIYRGVRADKKDDYRFSGFHAPTHGPIGIITEKIDLRIDRLRKPEVEELSVNPNFAERIIKINQFPGLLPELYYGILENSDVSGIIIQTLGIGNLPTEGKYEFRKLLNMARENKIPVIITTEYPVLPEYAKYYAPAQMAEQLGAISASTLKMSPAAAEVKFMWSIFKVNEMIKNKKYSEKDKLKEIKVIMDRDYVGELNPGNE